MITRRTVLHAISLAAVTPRLAVADTLPAPFGRLLPDPDGILDLPAGFRYRVISTSGDTMDDGLLVPARADGMAAFDAGGGRIALVCNHENRPLGGSAFGPDNELLHKVHASRLYDAGLGETPGAGGTTTIIYDPLEGRTLRRHLSLAGTEINCAGGATPWGSWLSCEECFEGPGRESAGPRDIVREKRHGYVFEVPWDAAGPVEPKPIRAMGRFEHEAAAVHPDSGVVYLSEDKHRSLLYRYLPSTPGRLADGGRLQALAIAGAPSFDTRNWDPAGAMPPGRWYPTRWIELEDPDPDENDLRLRGFRKGAARFARGEGLCFGGDSLFMTATIGGRDRLGQVFEYRPSRLEGQAGEADAPGRLRLLAECSPQSLLRNADNLTMSPWGDLVVCEDTATHCGLIGLTPDGRQYEIADNPEPGSELAGICFSPDGGVMFVNVQRRGLTLAITGPWSTLTTRAD